MYTVKFITISYIYIYIYIYIYKLYTLQVQDIKGLIVAQILRSDSCKLILETTDVSHLCIRFDLSGLYSVINIHKGEVLRREIFDDGSRGARMKIQMRIKLNDRAENWVTLGWVT